MAGHTLLLDTDTWDLTLDAGGNIATTTDSYGIAQNVANAVRLFTNDAWYDPDRGIPHFVIDLGLLPQDSLVRARMTRAARGVDGVAGATVDITGLEDRVLTGTISLTLENGDVANVAI